MSHKKICSECKEKDLIIRILRARIAADRECVLWLRSQLDDLGKSIKEMETIQKNIHELEKIIANPTAVNANPPNAVTEQAQDQISKLRPRKSRKI